MAMSIEPQQSQTTGGGTIPVDSFGNRLMLARAHAGHISIREAADLCNIGRGAWTNWEKGARPVDVIDVVEVIAEKLGVDREWLLFGGQLSAADRRTRRRLSSGSSQATASYLRQDERPTGHPAVRSSRPRDNRPSGHPSDGGTHRTARIPRDRGPK